MAFKDIRFPDLYNLDVTFIRERRADNVTTLSGKIVANEKWAYTRFRARMSWGPKLLDGLQEIINFWEVVTTKHTWRIRNAQDYTSTVFGGTITPTNQQQAIGDDALTEVQLVKSYTYGSENYVHPIFAPVDGTVRLAIDGTEITEGTDWSIDYSTGIITLTTALASGEVLTAGYEYDLKCQFVDDSIQQSFLVQNFGRIDSFTIAENPE